MEATLKEGGGTGPQGHIPHKKNPEGENRLGRGPKSPPWRTTVLNLEFKPGPLVISAYHSMWVWGQNSFTREKLVDVGVYSVGSQARAFFPPEIPAPPP